MIDGSPSFFKHFTEFFGHSDTSDELIQNEILTSLVQIDFPNSYQEIMKNHLAGRDWGTKIDSFIKIYDKEKNFAKKYSKDFIFALFRRLKMAQTLNEASFSKLKSSKMSLIVPNDKLVPDIEENYNLHQYCSDQIQTLVLTGNHVSILHNIDLSKFINSLK